jgi:hypothetical protein
MHTRVLATLLALSAPAMVLAEERSEVLMDLMSQVPTEAGPALLAHDYVEKMRDAVTAWTRGEDCELDRNLFNMANPFGGDMGKSSRVAIAGDLLVQSAGWPLIHEVLDTGTSKGHPDLAAFAAALDSPDWSGAQLLQAAKLPH